MEILTVLVRLGLIAVVATAAICAIAYGLMRMSKKVDRDVADLYDWEAEGDFTAAPSVPQYLRDNHNLMPSITDNGAEARCSCGHWSTFVPSASLGQQRAYDLACDLYWSGHIASLGATA